MVDGMEALHIPAGSMFGILGPNGAASRLSSGWLPVCSAPMPAACGSKGPPSGRTRHRKARIGVVRDDPHCRRAERSGELIEFSMDCSVAWTPPPSRTHRDELLKMVDLEDDGTIPLWPITARGRGARSPSVVHCSSNPPCDLPRRTFSGLDPVATETMERVLHRHPHRGARWYSRARASIPGRAGVRPLVVIDHGRVGGWRMDGPVDQVGPMRSPSPGCLVGTGGRDHYGRR